MQYADINSLTKWPLTSFPGSGVTWTRQIIEGVTGIYTGSWHLSDPSPFLKAGTVPANNRFILFYFIIAHVCLFEQIVKR